MVTVIVICLCIAGAIVFARAISLGGNRLSRTFELDAPVVVNPLIGFAPPADAQNENRDHSLVYVDITFAELEPEEGEFAFDEIERTNQLERWRAEGKHGVLRFLCDVPRDEAHKDVPEWLFDKIDGAGTYYDTSYGKGYSPDYENEIFIAHHAKAIEALGKRYGNDTFFSYVELGSLGHWGEWHVKFEDGIDPLPLSNIRDQYIAPYLRAFPNAKLMMRRPFMAAACNGMGLFNDMVGEEESTAQWLEWIRQGGEYNQTDEKNALTAMPNAWKTAPIGGEFTSEYALDWMLSVNLDQTLEMVTAAHTTFIGPKCPAWNASQKGAAAEGAKMVLQQLGYRIGVSAMSVSDVAQPAVEAALDWTNTGTAPIYWDWPIYLYVVDGQNQVKSKTPVTFRLSKLLPHETRRTKTTLSLEQPLGSGMKICVGIEDPMTGQPAIALTTNAEKIGNMTVLYEHK